MASRKPRGDETELERRLRQRDVIRTKGERAEMRGNAAGVDAARLSLQATDERIAELQAEHTEGEGGEGRRRRR